MEQQLNHISCEIAKLREDVRFLRMAIADRNYNRMVEIKPEPYISMVRITQAILVIAFTGAITFFVVMGLPVS